MVDRLPTSKTHKTLNNQGLENVEIAQMMLEQRGTDRANVLENFSISI